MPSKMPDSQLAERTVVFGLHLWVVVGVGAGAAVVLIIFLLSLCVLACRRRPRAERVLHLAKPSSPPPARNLHSHKPVQDAAAPKLLPDPAAAARVTLASVLDLPSEVDLVKAAAAGGANPRIAAGAAAASHSPPEVSQLGWGHRFALEELEAATGGFSTENVIGQGGYGVVYHGVLADGTEAAVKNLLNNRGQAEKEFKVEVEAIGRVRHKNLVRLLGYCADGDRRLLVYEYVDNGNLEQWLHGRIGPTSALTWDIRMKIILGTAKGLMYLHEGLEPKVVHRDIKSSNILLDRHWNAKLSDFGLAKLLGPERSYVTTRVMGTFGYVAPEYAGTGMLNETSDVYSFGILIMEIISGRVPVDYNRPPGEVNLIDWLKVMVSNRNSEGIVDPRMPDPPSSRSLKKTLLVALRCVDPDARKRPKIGNVIHMLEVDDFPYRDDRRAGGGGAGRTSEQVTVPEGQNGYSGSSNDRRTMERVRAAAQEVQNGDAAAAAAEEPLRWSMQEEHRNAEASALSV